MADISSYRLAYIDEMRRSYGRNQAAWINLLRQDEVTLGCYCHDPVDASHCHRIILAWLLLKVAALHHIDAQYQGERTTGPRVAIVGSREHPHAVAWTRRIVELFRPDGCVVSGNAIGVDRAAERAGIDRGIMVVSLPCSQDMWTRSGNAAGMIRNRWIEQASDAVIALPWGKASGTLGMMEITKVAKKPLLGIVCDEQIPDVSAFLRSIAKTNSPTIQAGFKF